MKISVVICTCNRQNSLERAILSCLRQSVKPSEIIIIDDGESDAQFISDMRKKTEEPAVKFLYRQKTPEEKGLTRSRNLAVQMTKCEIIQFLDDDAELEENCIELLVRAYSADTQCELAGLDFPIIEKEREKRGRRMIEVCYNLAGLWRAGLRFQKYRGLPNSMKYLSFLKPNRYLQGGSMALRKSYLEKIGGFDTALGTSAIGEDKDISIRLSVYGCLARVTSASVIHHSEQSGRSDPYQIGCETSFNYLRINKKLGPFGLGEWLIIPYNLLMLFATELIFAIIGNSKMHSAKMRGMLAGAWKFLVKSWPNAME